MDRIPTGKLSRIGVYGSMATKVGINSLGSKVKKVFNREDKNELNAKNSKVIFEALSKLRGTALKFAQMLSLEDMMLTEEYKRELNKSTYRVRPLNRAVVRKTIKNELKNYPEKIFTKFDTLAFAAASLGQVHYAQDDKKNKLAIKMQYPGIDETLRHDMSMIKIAYKMIPHSPLVDSMLEEIDDVISREVDYIAEAKYMNWFSQKMSHLDIVIPKVYPKYSTDKVLVMEFIEGKHLDVWLESNPSQELRNRMAQKLFDLYCFSFFELKTFQADSNIGNYLFLENEEIAFLDFGCIKRVPDTFPPAVIDLVRASIDKDREAMLEAYLSLGMLTGRDDEAFDKYYESVFIPFADWTASPYREKTFHFSLEKNFASSAMEANLIMGKAKEFRVQSSDYVYFSRGLYGLYKIFEQMDVTIEMRSRLPDL